jgi:two-component SAPR family response regulator
MIDPPWRIELFGGLRVTRGDRCHTRFRTQKTELLLAYLAYFLRPHPREALMGLLWADAEPSAARHSLSQALSSLRHVLEPSGVPAGAVLAADRIGVGLDPDAVTTDAVEFGGALRAAGTSGGAGQASWLGRAVELYRGELLAGRAPLTDRSPLRRRLRALFRPHPIAAATPAHSLLRPGERDRAASGSAAGRSRRAAAGDANGAGRQR